MAETKKEELDVKKLVAEAVAEATKTLGAKYEGTIADLEKKLAKVEAGSSKGDGEVSITRTKPSGKLYLASYDKTNTLSLKILKRSDAGELAYLGVVSPGGIIQFKAGKAIAITGDLKKTLESKYIEKTLNKVGGRYINSSKKDEKYVEACPFTFKETSLKDLGL